MDADVANLTLGAMVISIVSAFARSVAPVAASDRCRNILSPGVCLQMKGFYE